MLEIKNKVSGPYHVREDTIITGMIAGDLIVEGKIQLDLRGMVTGNVIAKAGSSIEIHGMVIGTVVNRGAEITIHGMVGGVANIDENAKTNIVRGAVVRE